MKVADSKNRIDFLDYLKAICVILVIITHYDWADKSSYIFTMFINMAVPVFMIISGYNFAMSNRKKTDGSIKSMYNYKLLYPKIKRFLDPFLIICIIEIFLLAIEHKNINPTRIFFFGAYGPGSYYVPIMIQLLIIFPIIYRIMEKSARLGLIIIGLINLLFEILVTVLGIDEYYYRLLLGRYLLLIALGCFIYLYPQIRVKKGQLITMLIIGMAYIILVLGNLIHLKIFKYWAPTAMPIAFYIFPIVILLFRCFYNVHISGLLGSLLSIIGKASYHIFLIQMVYYHFELGGIIMRMKWFYAIPYNIIITLSIGIGFYYIDNYFRKRFNNKSSNYKLIKA